MITHLNEKLIAVEVPSDAKFINVTDLGLYYSTKNNSDFIPVKKCLKILGEVDADNISFDVKKLPEMSLTIKEADLLLNEHDKIDFRKLLQSKGIDTNKPNVKHVILEKV